MFRLLVKLLDRNHKLELAIEIDRWVPLLTLLAL